MYSAGQVRVGLVSDTVKEKLSPHKSKSSRTYHYRPVGLGSNGCKPPRPPYHGFFGQYFILTLPP